jgi:hypothetical protein
LFGCYFYNSLWKEKKSTTNAFLPDGRSLIYDYGCWRGGECGWAPQRWRASCWSYVPSPPPPPPPSPSYRSGPPGHASSSQSFPQAPVIDTYMIQLVFPIPGLQVLQPHGELSPLLQQPVQLFPLHQSSQQSLTLICSLSLVSKTSSLLVTSPSPPAACPASTPVFPTKPYLNLFPIPGLQVLQPLGEFPPFLQQPVKLFPSLL